MIAYMARESLCVMAWATSAGVWMLQVRLNLSTSLLSRSGLLKQLISQVGLERWGWSEGFFHTYTVSDSLRPLSEMKNRRDVSLSAFRDLEKMKRQ